MREGLPTGVDADQLVQDLATGAPQPRAKQNARRTRARTIAALEEVTQTLETTLDGLRAAHAAVPPPMLPPSTLCSRGCGRAYHATYGNEPLCLPCRRADVRPDSTLTDRSRSPRNMSEARLLPPLA